LNDYWMPAFAGMTIVDGLDKPGHDALLMAPSFLALPESTS